MIVACFCGEVLEGDVVTFCPKCLTPVSVPVPWDTTLPEPSEEES